MGRKYTISKILGQGWFAALWLFFGLFLATYFTYHTFQGDNSLSSLQQLKAQEIELVTIAADVRDDRLFLERRITAMQSNAVDPDMLEQQVRIKLGFTHPDEVVLLTSHIN